MPGDQNKSVAEFHADAVLSEIDEAANIGAKGIFRSIKVSQDAFATRHELERKAMARMAALKRFAPLVLAVIHRPGPKGKNEDISSALQQMMESSFNLANEMIERISGGQLNSEFIQDQAISAVSEFVGTEWAFNGKTDVHDRVMFAIDHLSEMDDVIEEIATTSWKPGGNALGAELGAGLTMSMVKASEPIISTLHDFDVHEPEVFEKLADFLLDESMNYLSRVSKDLPSTSRLMMIQNHLGVSGRIMKVSLISAFNATMPGEKLDLKPVIEDWRKGLQILDSAVESKVSIALSREDLLKPSQPKQAGLTP